MAKLKIVPGKWYVIDSCAAPGRQEPIAGPFDTKAEADADLKGSNIEGDLYSLQAPEKKKAD